MTFSGEERVELIGFLPKLERESPSGTIETAVLFRVSFTNHTLHLLKATLPTTTPPPAPGEKRKKSTGRRSIYTVRPTRKAAPLAMQPHPVG